MNLKSLSGDDLLLRFGKLVQTERKITHLILECLNEIELRCLHLEWGYSSLYYLLTEKYGYSPASAQRRIDGARLLRQVPALANKIENGDLNLTKVSQIQKSIKQAEKESNTKYTREQKQILVEKVAMAQGTIEQTQVLLAQELNLSIPIPHEKTQHHKDASVTLTLHLTSQEMEQIKQVRDLLSNSTQSLELKDLFIYLAQKELKKYDKKNKPAARENIKKDKASASNTGSLVGTHGVSLSQEMNNKKDNENGSHTTGHTSQSKQNASSDSLMEVATYQETQVGERLKSSSYIAAKTKRSIIKPMLVVSMRIPEQSKDAMTKSFSAWITSHHNLPEVIIKSKIFEFFARITMFTDIKNRRV